MKILITGSSGQIGRILTPFLQRNFEVTILKSRLENLDENEFNVDIVIHLAGIIREQGKEFMEFYKINTEGTQNIVKMCQKKNCKLIHISTTAIDHKDFYGASKMLAEKAVKESGLQALVLRFDSILFGNSWMYYTINDLCVSIQCILWGHKFENYEVRVLRSPLYPLLRLRKKIKKFIKI